MWPALVRPAIGRSIRWEKLTKRCCTLAIITLPPWMIRCVRSWKAVIRSAQEDKDSVGGVIECMALHLPVGLGEPYFDSVESTLSQLLFSIPAVKGVEFGDGFSLAGMRGSEANDPMTIKGDKVVTTTNRNGGILGGLTTGMPLLFRVVVKPTASIYQPQHTVNIKTHEETILEIKGRHDPCIVPRAVPVVEAMTAWALCDLMLCREREL